MSAMPPEADIRQRIEHVCFVPVPLADIRRAGQSMQGVRVSSEVRTAVQQSAGFWARKVCSFRAVSYGTSTAGTVFLSMVILEAGPPSRAQWGPGVGSRLLRLTPFGEGNS